MSELSLLKGKPLQLGSFNIYSPTLEEIEEITEDMYYKYVLAISIGKENLSNVDDMGKLEDYDLLVYYFQENGNTYCSKCDSRKNIFNGLYLFTRQSFYFAEIDGELTFISMDNPSFVINRGNYGEFRNIIKTLACIPTKQEQKYASEKAKEIADKIRKSKQIVNKSKGNTEDLLELSDLISVFVANNGNYNLLNVWTLTFWQFQNQFKRMQMLEEYDINIRSLLAGADQKKIDLKHYLRKIKL